MTRMTIEFDNCRKRIVVYREGGCHLEEYVKGIGWCMNDWDTVDFMPHMLEAMKVLATATEKAAA